MLIYNVFGRHIGVQRQGERWQLFRVDLNEEIFAAGRGYHPGRSYGGGNSRLAGGYFSRSGKPAPS
jgi:hypothetical protein